MSVPHPPKMTAARARTLCEDYDEIEDIARIVSEAPRLPDHAVAQLRDDGCPVIDSSGDQLESA